MTALGLPERIRTRAAYRSEGIAPLKAPCTGAAPAPQEAPPSAPESNGVSEVAVAAGGDEDRSTSLPSGCAAMRGPARPDENKENIAPVRQVSPAILAHEAQQRPWESIAMRTRRRRQHVSPVSTQEAPEEPVQPSLPQTPRKKRKVCTPPASSSSSSSEPHTPTATRASSSGLPTPPATPCKLRPYAHARACLRDEALVGRATERARIHTFMDESLAADGNTSGCLYVSGMPGTGKTALVRDVLRARPERHLYINCVGHAHPGTILTQLAAALGLDDVTQLAHQSLQHPTSLIVVLDEMDHLLHTHDEVLHTLFCLPAQVRQHTAARIALVGIANSLDLTERFVPWLRSLGVPPALLHFAPLSAEGVCELLTTRLRDAADMVTRPALQLLARKLSANTGDVRRALDTCRQALDLAEQGGQPQVTPTHVLRVVAHMAGHAQVQRVRALSVHAKLLLLAWVVLQAQADVGLQSTRGDGGVRLCDLEDMYMHMLQNDGAFVTPLESSELLDVLERLEVQGLVRVYADAGGGSAPPAFSRSTRRGSGSPRVSPSGKRTAARQLLATNRRMAPTLERACIVRALTEGASADAGDGHTQTVVDAMSRLLRHEEDQLARRTAWRDAKPERERVRRDELGGGRTAIGW
ncbi:AAA ATPase [Malassezia nana]|uniref:AAA ATPase n=1 Tax=Malassezia nana TaxID=180528 RepID=A0AAF0EM96_9BASI|nr:AAA ATPase [Malassezia nana]